MTLEIIEQELLERKDSKIILKGIDGIWEPELHILRVNFKESNLVKNKWKEVVFPITVKAALDNDEGGIDIFRIGLENDEELYRIWGLDENDINVILDIVFPSTVLADIVPEKSTPSIQYIESRGKVISGNLYDLLSESLSESDLKKFADKESWYRYIRVSSDKSLSSAQHIDASGKIISQEYIYYRYKNLRVFFDGGKSRLFNLGEDAKFIKLSGYADREEYYVKGDSNPILLRTSVVHIKEVPGVEINPRSMDEELFSGRFNYTNFTLYCGEDENGVKLISTSPKSINFVVQNSDSREISNTISFGACPPQNDIWEYLEASTDLDLYRDSNSNPVFFLSGPTTISFVVWNAFRETVYYDNSNVSLSGDIASHFDLKVQSWDKNTWGSSKNGVVEVNIISDGNPNLNGVLSLIDTEDQSTIASFTVRTLSEDVKDNILAIDSEGKAVSELCFTPSEGNDNYSTFDILQISNSSDTLKTKFLNVYELSCPLTGNQSHTNVYVSFPDSETEYGVKTNEASYLADSDEIDLSLYLNKSIILKYGKEYKLRAPGVFIDSPEGPNPYLNRGQNPQEADFKADFDAPDDKTVVHYELGSSSSSSSTYIYLIKDTSEDEKLRINYSGFRLQETEKYLFGYLLVGPNLESVGNIVNSAVIIPVYTLPNVGGITKTAYDRCPDSGDIYQTDTGVMNAVRYAAGDNTEDWRNVIVGTGKTWIDLYLPARTYTIPGEGEVNFKYDIKPPISSDSSYIQSDVNKWLELTGGKGEYSVYGGNEEGIKIPIDIVSLPENNENGHTTDITVSISIGDAIVEETFRLFNPAVSISFTDNNIVSADSMVYVEPTNLYYPDYMLVGTIRNRYRRNYGPAYNIIQHTSFETLKSHISSVSSLSLDNIKLYDGVVTRGDSDTFAWSSEESGNLVSIKSTLNRNEYSDPEFHSRFVPESREYEVTYNLHKIDDYFPQYPAGKLVFQGSKTLYLFYMPANPYTMAAASKRHYIYVSPENLQKKSANDPNDPPIITGNFVVGSNFFLFDDFETTYDVNIPDTVEEELYSSRSARYLFHPNGWFYNVTTADTPNGGGAFKGQMTVTKSQSSDPHESFVSVNYTFDLSQWNGIIANKKANNAAELFVMSGLNHRDIFPSDLSSIIGHSLNWKYSPLFEDTHTSYLPSWLQPWTDGSTYSWDEKYYNGIVVPGEQPPATTSYLITDAPTSNGSRVSVDWPAFRCQMKVTDGIVGEESDLVSSCYGLVYSYTVPGDYSSEGGLIVDQSENGPVSTDRFNPVYDSASGKTTVDIYIDRNLPDLISPEARIEELYYENRIANVHTSDRSDSLNIEQYPSSGYFYYKSGTYDASIYPACQDPALSAYVVDNHAVDKAGGEITVYFEYMDTSAISSYINDGRTDQHLTFLNYLSEPSRDRIAWNGDTENEIDPIFEIITEGDLEFEYSLDLNYMDNEFGIGKIVISYEENTAENEKTGVLKVARVDNSASLVVINLLQPGNNLVSGASGIINSAGVGRLSFASEYPRENLVFSGPLEIKYCGNNSNIFEYKVLFPENHTPVPVPRIINISNRQEENSEPYTILLEQGYHGIHIWKKGSGSRDNYSLDCDSSGKYVFGSISNLADLDSKYCFDYYLLEPVSENSNTVETEMGEEQKAYSEFNITDLNIKSVNYQIVSPNQKDYAVSDIFSSISADVVYDGTLEDPYPYIQTLGTIYENKKGLGLALVVELEISMEYTTEISYNIGGEIRKEAQTLEAINKVQIWYKI